MRIKLTVRPSVVGLDMHGLDLAVLDDEGVPLRARVSEDGDHVEAQIQRLREGAGGIGQEPDLRDVCCERNDNLPPSMRCID